MKIEYIFLGWSQEADFLDRRHIKRGTYAWRIASSQ